MRFIKNGKRICMTLFQKTLQTLQLVAILQLFFMRRLDTKHQHLLKELITYMVDLRHQKSMYSFRTQTRTLYTRDHMKSRASLYLTQHCQGSTPLYFLILMIIKKKHVHQQYIHTKKSQSKFNMKLLIMVSAKLNSIPQEVSKIRILLKKLNQLATKKLAVYVTS